MTRRERTVWGAGLAAAAALVVAGAAVAGTGVGPEDDLTVVKRAVAAPRVAQAAPEPPAAVERVPDEPRSEATRIVRRSGKELTWLKVRVVEKASHRKKVTVNLPLALVRAVGDDWPRIDFDCGDRPRNRCGIKVSEVLAALESGQDLVEIDDEDTTVRIWVE